MIEGAIGGLIGALIVQIITEFLRRRRERRAGLKRLHPIRMIYGPPPKMTNEK